MKTVAIIPAYNEQGRIRAAVLDAALFCDEVVVVDDGATDGSGEDARNAGAHVLRHVMNRGQGAALQTGTNYAVDQLDADIIIHFDADGQMQGKDIPELIAPILRDDADVVLGSRFLGKESNMPLGRRVTLKLALLFTRIFSGIPVTDPHCGFRALGRTAAQNIELRQDRMAHASEILDLIHSAKLRYVGCPVEIRYTDDTLEKGMGFFDGFTVLKDYFKHKFFDSI